MQQDQASEDKSQPTVRERPTAEQVAATIRELIEGQQASEAVATLLGQRPADQADVVTRLSHDYQLVLLAQMQPMDMGVLIEALGPDRAVGLYRDMSTEQLSQVLDETSLSAAADLLRALPVEVAANTLEQMEVAESVAPLLEYDDNDAGGLMTPEFVALRDTMTVTQSMTFIREWAEQTQRAPEDIHFIFVVDYRDVLRGGLTLGQLVLARPNQRVVQLMDKEFISVADDTDQEQAARLMGRYHIHSLPVVNPQNVLVGVLRMEDMVDVLEDEATEDMYRMIGVDEEEKALGPFWRSVSSRLPWLVVNLGTAMLAGAVVTMFQSTIAQVIALAAFLPVIAGQGGIAGTQSLTLIVRSLALGEVSPSDTKRLVIKEVSLGLVHGLALGLLVGLIAYIWQGNAFLALVVGISMLANLVVAGFSGVVVPLSMRAMRLDPALSSAVAVTTMTDVVGFLVYLGLASASIAYLVA
ncbi:MAG: magnesium transporter [Chloroflexi bacterium]|nr:magnesium transporter [Chloroflexota bacterium]MDA1226794.1 magnesium transporter [Chloroflexota bacterium]